MPDPNSFDPWAILKTIMNKVSGGAAFRAIRCTGKLGEMCQCKTLLCCLVHYPALHVHAESGGAEADMGGVV